MKILPGRYEKHLVNYLARSQKKKFNKNIEFLKKKVIQRCSNSQLVDFNLVSFSGVNHLDIQLLSLFSFYLNVGLPKKWTILSDGSYSVNDKKMFEEIPNVEVKIWNEFDTTIDKTLLEYAKFMPFGKRFHAYMNLQIDETTILTDSDILFYKDFTDFVQPLKDDNINWYLLEPGPSYREDYYWTTFGKPSMNYLNAGFLVLNYKPNWDIALDYIINRKAFDGWHYYTEQTAIDIMFQNDKNAQPLNPRHFIFDTAYAYFLENDYSLEKKFAMRHFAGAQARSKIWQTDFVKELFKLI